MSEAVHVVPVDDSVAHETTGDDCICGPEIEFVDGGKVVVHHSLDGRENDEDFRARLRASMERNAQVLERLAESDG